MSTHAGSSAHNNALGGPPAGRRRSENKRALATRESIGNTGANHTYDGSRVVDVMGRVGPTWNYTPLEQAIEETTAAYRAQLAD